MTYTSDELAKHMASVAKKATLRYGPTVDYSFAFGFLTGTLAGVLKKLTPEQLEDMETQFDLETTDRS